MEKTLFVIYALSLVLLFVIWSNIFKQVKSKGFFSLSEDEFMRDLSEKNHSMDDSKGNTFSLLPFRFSTH